MSILSEAQLLNAAGLEGPEKLGLGTDKNAQLEKLLEAEERSDQYSGFRDFFRPFVSAPSYVRGGAKVAEGIMKGLGTASDVLGLPYGSMAYDKYAKGFKDFGESVNRPSNVVRLEDQPKPGDQDFKRPDSIFAEEGPLGSITDDVMAKINARDDFDAKRDLKRDLIDEEANLKSFPPTGGQIGEAQTDAESIEALGGDPTEDLFSSAMQDYITGARGAGPDSPEKKTIEDYKKEFSEATGIDVSGKVDKSSALMAMGLALMQNKAGKGFNVGKILSEVGRAGEKALPKLEAAKKEAKVGAAQAGKYAIEMRSADEAKRTAAKEKAMNRENYYIIPKGEGISGQIANLDKGSLETLNKYELSSLMENPEFSAKFDVLPGSTWKGIVEEAMKTPEAKEKYITTGRFQNLIPGLDDKAFQIRLFDPNPNTNPNGNVIMAGDGSEYYRLLARMAQDTEKAKQKFIELGGINKGTNVFRYSINALDGVAEAFGLNFVEGTNPTQKMKKILTQLQAKNAPRILGEAGKTISDADRQMVKDIVGNVTIMSSEDLLAEKFTDLFNDIIVGAENDIRQGLDTLNKYTGRKIGDKAYNNKALDKEGQERLNNYMKQFMNRKS